MELSRAGSIFTGEIGLGKPQWAVAGVQLCCASDLRCWKTPSIAC